LRFSGFILGAPVADHHVHPIEPLAVRLTLAGPLP
jgi:hypothetical protein